MELIVTSYREGHENRDPLFRYLSGYMEELSRDYAKGMFSELEDAFRFMQSRMESFFEVNPNYKKPASLALCYCRPSCCEPTIRLSYMNDFVVLKKVERKEVSRG